MDYVVLVSKFPPPLGGVTIFAQRKAAKLQRAGSKINRVDLACWYWPLLLLRARRSSALVVNTVNLSVLAVIFLLGRLGRSKIYDHNGSRHYVSGTLRRSLYLFFVRKSDGVVVVHHHLVESYDQALRDKITIESPFIEPDLTQEADILRDYPDEVKHFMCKDREVKIVNSAWKYVEDDRGRDLYGIGASVRLVSQIVTAGLSAKLLLAFGEFNYSDMPLSLQQEIDHARDAGYLVILDGQKELWPVLRTADVFLRLTSTDGQSISVHEALHFGCAVVASDVVPRPADVLLYRYGDDAELLQIVQHIISKRSARAHA
ncbi:hypothetical protein [Halomonas kalidii]|uniref:Glycosyl transferase family 1 domain-containing protein n=1 Tax=Halomonas kalidii TaxID=3043293 RepID=A0ABT6VK56_9GAMM|nr:hypothetical protein [Halomonas kalidii]MDI5934355.1 hypothetical protein [Halomonas kalidii]